MGVTFANAQVFRQGRWQTEDLSIQDGLIVAPQPSFDKVDLKGKLVFPGLIDVHVHLRDGNLSPKETYKTGAQAALAGRITTCLVMANGDPICDGVERVRLFKAKTKDLPVRLLPIGAVTKGLEGTRLVDFQRMMDAGVVAFSDDGHTLMDGRLLSEALQWSQLLRFTIILHEEDRCLSPVTGMNDGRTALELGFSASHEVAESAILVRDLEILENFAPEARLHVAHVSSPKTLRALHRAQKDGLNVSCEVTPHHLYFNEDHVRKFSGRSKMAPPLRSESTRQFLWESFKEGGISICATDHAPHTLAQKKQGFEHCPCGVVGLETAVSTLWTLAQKDLQVFARAISAMTDGPAKRFQIDGGSLELGARADVVVFDPDVEWEVRPEKFQSKAKHSPWEGERLQGKVVETWVQGEKVFSL